MLRLRKLNLYILRLTPLGLRTSEGEGTTILVTHRIDLLRQAPRILFLENGKLAADGVHANLIDQCPAYAEAYNRWAIEESAFA